MPIFLSFTEDGYFDLVTPYIGFGLVITWRWVAVGLIGFFGGAALFILGHRLFRKKWPWEGMD